MRNYRLPNFTRVLLCACTAATLAACGLIDTDIADFDLSLPQKDIVIDTGQWELTGEESMPSVDCSERAEACSLGIEELCGADGVCVGSCNADQTCDVKILVNLWHDFDLAKEKPELEEIEGQPLVSVEIKKIAYRVKENTLNVDTPEMTVYVAPAGVMSPDDPQAQAIGTLAPISAGMVSDEEEVTLTPNGRAILAGFMQQYSVPFNLIVGTEIDIHAGDLVPTGRLTTVVLVTAVAGI